MALVILFAMAMWQSKQFMPTLLRWWQNHRAGRGFRVSVPETRSLLFTLLLWVALLRLVLSPS